MDRENRSVLDRKTANNLPASLIRAAFLADPRVGLGDSSLSRVSRLSLLWDLPFVWRFESVLVAFDGGILQSSS